MNKLAQFFYNEPKRRTIHKWEHYLDIYDKHCKKPDLINIIIEYSTLENVLFTPLTLTKIVNNLKNLECIYL